MQADFLEYIDTVKQSGSGIISLCSGGPESRIWEERATAGRVQVRQLIKRFRFSVMLNAGRVTSPLAGMKLVLSLVVLFVVVWQCDTLAESELTAISSLYEEWPVLRTLQPPWRPNASVACDNPPFSGLNCEYGAETHVTSLVLHEIEIRGSIPEAIGGLGWLQELSLRNGGIEGSIPSGIGDLLSLRILSLVDRQVYSMKLYGGIPSTIGQLKNLEELELVAPGFNETIPKEIGFCGKLRSFRLSSPVSQLPSFRGTLPKEFCKLTELRKLSLPNTRINNINNCIGALINLEHLDVSEMPYLLTYFNNLVQGKTKLKYLDISETEVRGIMNLEGLDSLEEFHALYSAVDGELDPLIWTMQNLTYIQLFATRLYGSISPQISQLTKLSMLSLSFQLIGTIPPEIGLCSELQYLSITDTMVHGTIPSALSKLSHLFELNLSGNQLSGFLPSSFSELPSIDDITISSNLLTSTIPESWTLLKTLSSLNLRLNRLSGTIPDFPPTLTQISLGTNLLTGTIPQSILSTAREIDFSQNHLSGTIPETLALNSVITKLDLSSNLLNGTLPTFSTSLRASGSSLDLSLSNNDFSGFIPIFYNQIAFKSLQIANNRLFGPIEILASKSSILQIFDIRNNRFNGTLPKPASLLLESLLLSNNALYGGLPKFPPSLVTLDASQNRFTGDISYLLAADRHSSLKVLDLSHNAFKGPLPDMSSTQLSFLSLASNAFYGPFNPPFSPQLRVGSMVAYLKELDLSDNMLTGMFPITPVLLSALSTLRISGNQFRGRLLLETMPQLAVLDISNNTFVFDAAEFNSHSNLVSLDVHTNFIYGALSLSGMSGLRTADFSDNLLNYPLNLPSIGILYSNYELELLSVSKNPAIPPITDLDKLSAVLDRTTSTSPSSLHAGVKCFQLAFEGSKSSSFSYDEPLFSYDQCECDDTNYGWPSQNCFKCPSVGTSPTNCSGPHLAADPNYFIYTTSPNSNHSQGPIGLESCFAANYHIGASNCLGLLLNWTKDGPIASSYQTGLLLDDQLLGTMNSSFIPLPSLLQQQCRKGSSGRLCWKCDCDASGKCFYPGPGNICLACKTVFRSSTYVPVALSLVLVALVVLTVVFFFVLRSKRSVKDTKWESLPIFKRAGLRLINMTTIGEITVIVTFTQIMVELTHWDVYAIKTWLKLVNGESEGLGLRCFFPFLANPMNLLLFKLFLPFFAAAFVASSIGLAQLCHRLLAYWNDRKRSYSADSSVYDNILPDSGDEMHISLMQTLTDAQQNQTGRVYYPTSALITTSSISIIRFFYFGAALSAHDYIFSERQELTGRMFVLGVPWMAYEDATTLRGVSIPFILLFLVVLPLAFVILAWKMRHKIASPLVRLYFGSLFESFQTKLYWWELVNISKKITVALVLRSLAQSDAFQPILLISILGTLLITTSTAKPWKHRLVNICDATGALLLIISLVTARLSNVLHFHKVLTFTLVVDGIFVTTCLFIIAFKAFTSKTDYQIQWELRFSSSQDSSSHTPPNDTYGPPLLNTHVDIIHSDKLTDPL